MQPSDQDELRRRAQEAMKRRIDTTARREEPPDPPRQPQQRQPQPQRRRQPPQDPRRQLERQPQGPPQPQQQTPPAPERIDLPEARPEPLTTSEQREVVREPLERDVRERVDTRVEVERTRSAYADPQTRVNTQLQRRRINQDLRDRDAVRRAFVMMEVLGKPVALRDPEEESFPGAG